MLSFLFTFLGAVAATLSGREAVRVSRLSAALGAGMALLAALWLACAIGSGVTAWIGTRIAVLSPEAGHALATVALALAAVELALLQPGRAPAEPTRSFGAVALVLSMGQLTSAAALIVLAVAIGGAAPEAATLGGALGAGAALTAAWKAGTAWEARVPRGVLRWWVAGLLLIAALVGWTRLA